VRLPATERNSLCQPCRYEQHIQCVVPLMCSVSNVYSTSDV
jgi:hypothetical protein